MHPIATQVFAGSGQGRVLPILAMYLAAELVILATPSSAADLTANGVYKQLIEAGIQVDGKSYPFPLPEMADGLSEKEQTAIVKKVSQSTSYKRFVAPNPKAPDITRLDDEKIPPLGAIRSADMYFVAHGQMEALRDEAFLKTLTSSEQDPNADGHVITAEELSDRTFEPVKDKSETIAFGNFRLLDKVRITGTAHSLWTGTAESLLLAGVLDERFKDDPKYPNRWRSLKKLESGEWSEGEPAPYSGAGFYMKITQLKAPAGAFFVETHLKLFEPQGWFEGGQTLKSKIPILATDRASDFRRKLLSYSK